MTRLQFVTVITLTICGLGHARAEFVPFVISSRTNPNSPIAIESKPISQTERLVTTGSHFYCGKERVRLWGVNLSFGANMPSIEDAPFVAARLASAGVNSVRFHHLDSANFPRGIWNPEKPIEFDKRALERLDFFVDQIAKNGIYVNLNLHVGRSHSRHLGLPDTKRNYDKVTNIFADQLIEAQRKYAGELLNHVNPHRNLRYADDSAIAIVEITNENSFFMWDGEQALRTMPDYYADILQKKYNNWLREKYNSSDKLRAAWNEGAEPLGLNILVNSSLQIESDKPVPKRWNLEQHNQCNALLSRKTYKQKPALFIEPTRIDDTSWHLQLNQGTISVKQDKYYTVSFKTAAESNRPLSCSFSQAHSPWNNLGLSQQVNLTGEWQSFQFGFVAKADDDNARLNFSFGTSDASFYIADIELRTGGREGLRKTESIEQNSVTLFAPSEVPARTIDRMKFLAETEKAYFDGMREFIKKDLGCKALVTGTIVFGPLGLYAQSDMDFIDTHAYWQHPRFPGRPWDSGNWIVEQKAMSDNPNQATLFELAASRLAGKPFTLTEYNHPAPSDYQAECVPMIAAFAAIQDWDGVWLYTYSHSSDDWDREHLNSYFDIDTNPAKWGFIRAGCAIFRDNGIMPLSELELVRLTEPTDVPTSIAKMHIESDRNMFNALTHKSTLQQEDMLTKQYAVTLTGRSTHKKAYQQPPSVMWSETEKGRAFFSISNQKGHVHIGHASDFESATKGKIIISEPAFLAFTLTAIDALPISESKKILVTACGRCENTDMKFSQDRRTVGRNWGAAPVMIETVSGSVKLPDGNWTCQALGPDMMPTHEVNLQNQPGRLTLNMSSQHKTMWYLLTRD
jgi:hypothetical protein